MTRFDKQVAGVAAAIAALVLICGLKLAHAGTNSAITRAIQPSAPSAASVQLTSTTLPGGSSSYVNINPSASQSGGFEVQTATIDNELGISTSNDAGYTLNVVNLTNSSTAKFVSNGNHQIQLEDLDQNPKINPYWSLASQSGKFLISHAPRSGLSNGAQTNTLSLSTSGGTTQLMTWGNASESESFNIPGTFFMDGDVTNNSLISGNHAGFYINHVGPAQVAQGRTNFHSRGNSAGQNGRYDIQLEDWAGNNNITAMSISGTGNGLVGINTTAPDASLTVIGSATVEGTGAAFTVAGGSVSSNGSGSGFGLNGLPLFFSSMTGVSGSYGFFSGTVTVSANVSTRWSPPKCAGNSAYATGLSSYNNKATTSPFLLDLIVFFASDTTIGINNRDGLSAQNGMVTGLCR